MDDNRLRGFSPPPWAALGRRDPEHEQAPWRESENVEDKRQMGWGDYLSAKANQVGHTVAAVPDAISALGTRPASDELMQRYMEEISRSLPQNETPRMGLNDKPFYYAGRADGGAVEGEQPERGFLGRAWDARPWKDHLNKPTDYGPLAIALGLVHPRLGSAVRDVGMSRSLMGKGETPAVLPTSLPLFRSEPGVTHSAGVSVGSSGTYRPETFNQFLASHNMQVRTPNADADRILRAAYDLSVHRPQKSQAPPLSPANVNARNPDSMKPALSVVSDAPGTRPAPSPYKPGSRVAQYEAHLAGLERAGVPYEQFPSWQAFLRGLDGKADGGTVEPKQPSFSEPLSGFIDNTLDGVKDYGRSAMDRAGWAPWAKGAGEVAMGVAATPFEAVSSASKLAMAPADWATGREVMASPWDVVGALPLAATGGLKALRHALDASDLKRSARAAEDFLTTKRDKGGFLPADLRIKQIIDEMAARRNMD